MLRQALPATSRASGLRALPPPWIEVPNRTVNVTSISIGRRRLPAARHLALRPGPDRQRDAAQDRRGPPDDPAARPLGGTRRARCRRISTGPAGYASSSPTAASPEASCTATSTLRARRFCASSTCRPRCGRPVRPRWSVASCGHRICPTLPCARCGNQLPMSLERVFWASFAVTSEGCERFATAQAAPGTRLAAR